VTRAGRLTVAVLAFAGAAAVPAHAAPVVDQLVVFRDGEAKSRAVSTDGTRVRAGGRRCRVPRATPLAALVRSRVRGLRVRDFSGSCDPSSLFVRSIAGDENRGQRGWVYKVGNRQGTTSASDPSGPFGSGRIRRRVRVTWFYCVFAEGGCQRTLGLRSKDQGDGTVTARVTGYDDEGRGAPVEGATVHAGTVAAETDRSGRATLTLPAGTHRLYAEKRGAIRSFPERVAVR
jgi:hypothetical protein